MLCLSFWPLEGLFPFGGSGYGEFEGVSGSWYAICVMGVCVVSPGMWVTEFHAFVAGCYVRGDVCFWLGFVVSSFVGDGRDGCGVVGVIVWVGCCRLCAGCFFVVLVASSLMMFSM